MSIDDVLSGKKRWHVELGDSAEILRTLPAGCVGAVVTDPPAGIGFMGLEFDRNRGGRAQWVAWLAEVLGHARAATRDGGRALVWSLPRTSHWTGCAVEDAGWSIESTVTHLFGTGWPKGSSQLKPAAETWWLSRTGRSTALNIEGCRVRAATADIAEMTGRSGRSTPNAVYGEGVGWNGEGTWEPSSSGRYPPNAVFSHAPGCRCVGERRVDATRWGTGERRASGLGYGSPSDGAVTAGHEAPDGTECVEAWECVEGCPVRELDAQSGESVSSDRPRFNSARPVTPSKGAEAAHVTGGFSDTGTAARFFPQFPADEAALFGYHAKPSRAERDAGVDGGNVHSTVKSIALMRWLVRLVTRPGDVVLDPFGGSGTTGVAALCEGRRVILVEREPRFAEIARQRCEHATPDLGVPVRVAAKPAPAADPRQRSLLDLLGSTP